MNLSNVSAFSINVPLEFLADKIVEIQDLRFSITAIETTVDNRIRIVAKLLKITEPPQTYNQIEPIIDEFMRKMNERRSNRNESNER